MRKLLAFLVFALPGLTTPDAPAKAWGEFGHLTVCDLAYRNLTDATQEQLKKLFQKDQGGITVTGHDGVELRHYTSFNVGCLEEDETPRRHPEDHFINVPRDTAEIAGNNCPGAGSCILAGIMRDFDILKDSTKSNEERVFALMALGHWIGDIHQPLHISYADDRGGNLIDARLRGRCGSSRYRVQNLHGLWDNCLLEAGLFERVRQRADYKKSWGRRTITYRAVDTLQANTGHAAEKALVGRDPWQWANESYAIAKSPEVLYCVKVGAFCQYTATQKELPSGAEPRRERIGQSYLRAFERTAEDRVKRAGFRLAHLINLALDPAYTEPLRNSTQGP
jgi:hypothetical protein